MQDDSIAVALGLPQLRILWHKELEDRFEVTVICRRGEAACLQCGRVTTKEHDRRQKHKQDRRLRDRVGERLVRRYVAEEVSRIVEAKGVEATPEFIVQGN